jgi:hypothetical protein
MCGSSKLTYNISNNCSDTSWYWEVIAPDHEILARGLASSSAEARAEAISAGASYVMPTSVSESLSPPFFSDQASL